MNDDPTQVNPVCQQMLTFRLTGNITPISWYRTILTESGKPDVVAITLLSDIMYWYTPIMTRDEHTGDVIGIQQKFQADKLQKTYQEYADIFGFSKAQIKAAIDNLCNQQLITREFRHIKTGSGLAITNVMYIEPILENIVKISNKIRSPQKVGGCPPKKLGDTPLKTKGASPQKVGGSPPEKSGDIPPFFGGTYTKISSENTSKNTTATTTAREEAAAAVFSKNNFPEEILSRIPEIYREHKDVLETLEAHLASHGQFYVLTEIDYAVLHSTREGGLPGFLKRSLENGWGTESLKIRKAAENEKFEKERRQMEQAEEARLAEVTLRRLNEQREKAIEEKYAAVLQTVPPLEIQKIEAEAQAEAKRVVPIPSLQPHAHLTAAAKEKLSALSQPEQETLRKEAEALVRAEIGNLISEKHPGFQRAVENHVLKIVSERYPLKTPSTSLWEERVKTEAKRIFKAMIIKSYGLFNVEDTAEAT
jgi:hypothetical protein